MYLSLVIRDTRCQDPDSVFFRLSRQNFAKPLGLTAIVNEIVNSFLEAKYYSEIGTTELKRSLGKY